MVKAVITFNEMVARDLPFPMLVLSQLLTQKGIKVKPTLDVHAEPSIYPPFRAYRDYEIDALIVEQGNPINT